MIFRALENHINSVDTVGSNKLFNKALIYLDLGRFAVNAACDIMSDVSKKINLLGLIGFIGTIILIVGVFLNWVTLDYNIILTKGSESLTGWDIYGNADYKDLFEYSYAPLVALVCGVISLITTLLPIVYQNEKVNKLLGIVTLILAVVAIVISTLFYTNVTDSISYLGMSASTSVGLGFWLCLVGAIITAVGGILDILKKVN